MISAGLAWYTGDKQEYDELIHCADLALYEAKNAHKGQLCEFQGES
jgi:GGDEF domain-containing protein